MEKENEYSYKDGEIYKRHKAYFKLSDDKVKLIYGFVKDRKGLGIRKFANQEGINYGTFRFYNLIFECDLYIKKVKEDYDLKMRSLERLTQDDKERKDTVLDVLYENCSVDKDTTACGLYLRATGEIKLAEVRARESGGEEEIDYEDIIDRMVKGEFDEQGI